MRTFLGRLSANAGSALAAAGSLLALGAALGAVGLAQLQPKESPLANGWVLAGFVVISLGAAWFVGTFILAMIATIKHEHFKELLGHALHDGEKLEGEKAPKSEVAAWSQQAADLIHAGLGSGEDRLFLGEWDFGPQYLSGKEIPGQPFLQRRLRQLMKLLARVDSTHVGAGAKLPKWKYVSGAGAQSRLAITRDQASPPPP
jgi:hypothetical protein